MSTEPTKVPELGASSDKNDILTNSGAGFFQVASGFGLRLSQDLFPKREDFNGLFNLLSKPLNWFCKGGFFAWDSDIATGDGYPIRAIVKATDNSGYYSNLVDNNTSNPNTGGANWEFIPTDIVLQAEAEAGTATIPRVWTAQRVKQAIDAVIAATVVTDYATKQGIQRNSYRFANAGGTANAITASFNPAVTSLTNGSSFLIQAAGANTVSNPTLAINGLPAKTIVKENNKPLENGDILGANFWMELVYDSSLDKFQLVNPSMINFVNKNIFGVGQVWSDVTATRDFDTVYTNNTGKTIFVSINVYTAVNADVAVTFLVNNLVAGYAHTKNATSRGNIYIPVPDGNTYKLTTSDVCSIEKWTELR